MDFPNPNPLTVPSVSRGEIGLTPGGQNILPFLPLLLCLVYVRSGLSHVSFPHSPPRHPRSVRAVDRTPGVRSAVRSKRSVGGGGCGLKGLE